MMAMGLRGHYRWVGTKMARGKQCSDWFEEDRVEEGMFVRRMFAWEGGSFAVACKKRGRLDGKILRLCLIHVRR